ncbi:sulfur oxidation c-type cytochrome SoxA [Sulfuricurvum sp.]|uniref:sulfur oxidation c-type cytochrome SoxA n=1 Tax=Sulfuricurvum sp. TaxID=2025608 RepID=UPI002632E1AB|nr:sulfur oxidation c-type cytochrome SoxA [Sulfuricurvum sp.]MDD2837658.1 sulfur oxidation c-type cytochrome SoxA [Sulfuricurvum sp.]MDD3596047.1 sulfur oxidation c-type cytochrome SoxA [Sulfuricurvum sp.]
MGKLSVSAALVCLALFSGANAEEKLSMSDADKAMYAEMLENNPADMDVAEGEQIFGNMTSLEAYSKMLGVKEKDLAGYIAGFPRYVDGAKKVITLSQSIQMAAADAGKTVPKLESKEMLKMTAYVKSLANGLKTNIDVKANKQMKEMMALGQEVFETRRGGRGLSCNSCHSPDIIGQRLRMQPLPDLGVNKAAGTWPAYRMTKSETTALDKRFQQCMDNALLAKIPLGSKEMVALEVYVTNKTKGNEIQIPGLKR